VGGGGGGGGRRVRPLDGGSYVRGGEGYGVPLELA